MTTVAEKYVAAVNNSDLEALMSLFAPTATLTHVVGTFSSPETIAEFYRTVVFERLAHTEIQAQFIDGDTQIIQIRTSSPLAEPGQYVYAADVFTTRDGLIERLDIYYR